MNAPGSVLVLLRVWPPAPLPPGTQVQRVVVEAEAPERGARGPFILELRDASGGAAGVTLEGVLFP
jgi:hypothetical protein